MDIQAIKDFRNNRSFLPVDFCLNSWDDINPYFEQLKQNTPTDNTSFENFLKQYSELTALLEEDMGWKYIKMTCDTANEDYSKAYGYFVEEISPKWTVVANDINNIILAYLKDNNFDHPDYQTFLRGIKREVELFREENIAIQTKCQLLESKFGDIAGAMSVELDGEELPMPMANAKMESTDRAEREKVWRTMFDRRKQDEQTFHELFDEMIELRTQEAKNAGFDNYRDYKHAAMGRFDYTPADCENFHESIKKEILPILDKLYAFRKKQLGLDTLKPWDLSNDIFNAEPLKPFSGQQELINKTVNCFSSLKPFYADCISTMKELEHLDLESRRNKAPGGYNYPLGEIGIPFIFMNAAGTIDDVITMVHEGGHAIHSFAVRELPIAQVKETPSEVAELASMSMELMSMEKWDCFIDSPAELRRAKIAQMERVLSVLPWVATVDKFQHWVYLNPNHSHEERASKWLEIYKEFSSNEVDESGLEDFLKMAWQKQLHIFEVPFYYIEYGIAQLGAIGMWKQFKENATTAMDNYDKALHLGYTRTIPEIYKSAGLQFDFAQATISSLASFVEGELDNLLND